MKNQKNVVMMATHRLLRPLIRILLRYGVSFVEFSELAKKTYIEISYNNYAIPGRSKSISRVAVLTGLSRKEVVTQTKLLEQGVNEDDDIRRPINRASRAISGWMQDKDFQDAKGNPRILDIGGEKASFKSLAKRYSGDVTHGAILDELVRVGAVELLKNNKAKLVAQAYIPQQGEIEKINIMGTSAHDLLTTVEHNISLPDQARFQREVVYTDLSQAGINEFKLISQDKCMALLLDLNQWLADKKNIEKRLGITQAGTRIGIGLYYIEDNIDANMAEGQNEEKETQ